MASTSVPKAAPHKRPLSPSIGQASATSASSSSAKKVRSDLEKSSVVDEGFDSIDDDFDDAALIEAASEIEEAANSSTPSKSQPSSQNKTLATKESLTRPAAAITKTSSASSFATQVSGDALLEAASQAEAEAERKAFTVSKSSLSHGDEKVERETMDKEWFDRLEPETKKPYFKQVS